MSRFSVIFDPPAQVWPGEPTHCQQYHVSLVASTGFSDYYEWWDRIDEISRARHLGENWDGDDASPPTVAIVNSAVNLLKELRRQHQSLPAPSTVCPTRAGRIFIEWGLGKGALEAEIVSADRANWMLRVPGTPTKFWECTIPPPEVRPMMATSVVSTASGRSYAVQTTRNPNLALVEEQVPSTVGPIDRRCTGAAW